MFKNPGTLVNYKYCINLSNILSLLKTFIDNWELRWFRIWNGLDMAHVRLLQIILLTLKEMFTLWKLDSTLLINRDSNWSTNLVKASQIWFMHYLIDYLLAKWIKIKLISNFSNLWCKRDRFTTYKNSINWNNLANFIGWFRDMIL